MKLDPFHHSTERLWELIYQFSCEAPRPQGAASRQGFIISYCAP